MRAGGRVPGTPIFPLPPQSIDIFPAAKEIPKKTNLFFRRRTCVNGWGRQEILLLRGSTRYRQLHSRRNGIVLSVPLLEFTNLSSQALDLRAEKRNFIRTRFHYKSVQAEPR